MNISSVAASATPALAPRPWGSSPADLEPPRPRPGAAPPGISAAGEVFGRLSALQQADPEKLKSTATDLASALRVEGQKAGGSLIQALGKLAEAFDKVAATGDLGALAPPPSAPPPQDARGASAGAYARQGPPPNAGDVQAMQQAMSFVATRLGVT